MSQIRTTLSIHLIALFLAGIIRLFVVARPFDSSTAVVAMNRRALAGAVITVRPANGGNELARAKAVREGRFMLLIQPGTYSITVSPPDASQMAQFDVTQKVIVRTGEFSLINVTLDSGIR